MDLKSMFKGWAYSILFIMVLTASIILTVSLGGCESEEGKINRLAQEQCKKLKEEWKVAVKNKDTMTIAGLASLHGSQRGQCLYQDFEQFKFDADRTAFRSDVRNFITFRIANSADDGEGYSIDVAYDRTLDTVNKENPAFRKEQYDRELELLNGFKGKPVPDQYNLQEAVNKSGNRNNTIVSNVIINIPGSVRSRNSGGSCLEAARLYPESFERFLLNDWPNSDLIKKYEVKKNLTWLYENKSYRALLAYETGVTLGAYKDQNNPGIEYHACRLSALKMDHKPQFKFPRAHYVAYTVRVANLPSASQSNKASAVKFAEEKSAITGVYARCPNDQLASCAQAKKTVKGLYGANISPRDLERGLLKYEIINLVAQTDDGKFYATITLPSGELMAPLDGVIQAGQIHISGDGLKGKVKEKSLTYRVDRANADLLLYGPNEQVFIRALTEEEVDELATD